MLTQSNELWALYYCDLGWMDKGGPYGEQWPNGRYFIQSRSEPKLFLSEEQANKARDKDIKDSVERQKLNMARDADSFYVNWDRLPGVILYTPGGMVFWYIKKISIEKPEGT